MRRTNFRVSSRRRYPRRRSRRHSQMQPARQPLGSSPATVLTAAVERRILTSTLIERGTVVADREVSVTPPAEAGLPVQVVTSVSSRDGDTVRPGQVVLAISGRPLIVLQGRLPPYRDL